MTRGYYAKGLIGDPFPPFQPFGDPKKPENQLFWKTYNFPDRWHRDFRDFTSMHFYTSEQLDLMSAFIMLEKDPHAFVISLSYLSHDGASPDHRDTLQRLTQALATSWEAWLNKSPDIYLHLSKQERKRLARLLVPSRMALTRFMGLLKRVPMKQTSRRRFKEWLLYELNKQGQRAPLWSLGELVELLRLRPSTTPSGYLLVATDASKHGSDPPLIPSVTTWLLAEEANLSLKYFSLSPTTLLPIPSTPIRWRDNDLKEIIATRMRLSSLDQTMPYTSFGSLFNDPKIAAIADNYLLQGGEGSLSRVLARAHTILKQAILNDPADIRLTEKHLEVLEGHSYPPSPDTSKDSHGIQRLRELLKLHFNTDEFRSLCADIEINYEFIKGDTLESKADELVLYCQRRQKLKVLWETIRYNRPNIDLPPWEE